MGWQGDEELDELTCPITLKTFQDPVFAGDGHTYERSAISEWIDRAAQGTPNVLLATRMCSVVGWRIMLMSPNRVLARVCVSGEGAAVAQDGPAYGKGYQTQPSRQTIPGIAPRTPTASSQACCWEARRHLEACAEAGTTAHQLSRRCDGQLVGSF
jgi:hypothetical protein